MVFGEGERRKLRQTLDERKKGDVVVDGFSVVVGVYFVRNEGKRIVDEIKEGLENIDRFLVEFFEIKKELL